MTTATIDWLPMVFIGLMGLSFLIYAILDGYDLGVGVLLPLDNPQQRYYDLFYRAILGCQ